MNARVACASGAGLLAPDSSGDATERQTLAEPNVGAIIADRFELGDFIAQGGMGVVYLGYDRQACQPVAIKRLRADVVMEDPELLVRFVREGEILRRLDHPNIVKLIAAVPEGGRQYIIMEYVAGGSLRDLLSKQPKLPIASALPMALELTDALSRAHHLKAIHRDIKPENVLLAEDGTPRLTDFGLARMGDERLTATDTIVGTIAYLSPEALWGQRLDERADIWACGVMLFEMLAGQHPFEGDHYGALITAIRQRPPADLEAIRPDLPVALIDLVYRMLEKDRALRILSTRQVGAELEAILKGPDVGLLQTRLLRPKCSWPRLAAQRRRRRDCSVRPSLVESVNG